MIWKWVITNKLRFVVDAPQEFTSDPWRLDDLMLVSWTE